LVSFAVVLTGFGLAALVRALIGSSKWVSAAAYVVLPVVVAVAAFPGLTGVLSDQPKRTVTAATIQGSVPRLGLDFNAQRRAVLDNHVRRTLLLADDIGAGRVARPDLVIWPENSSDIDPLRNADAYARISAAAAEVKVPILVGAVLVLPDG